MSVRPKVRGSAVAAGVTRGSVLADVPQLHHCVSSDELQDLPAGKPAADGDAKDVLLSSTAHGFSKRGWEPYSRAEHFNRKTSGRESGGHDAKTADSEGRQPRVLLSSRASRKTRKNGKKRGTWASCKYKFCSSR